MCEVLNNASVAAFLGAFFAFLLVVAANWLRRRQQKSTLTSLISDNLDHARQKRQSVKTNIELLQEDNKVTDAPYMRFPIRSIRDQQIQVLDLLSAAQKQGIDALIYWMEAVDDLLASATSKATELKVLIRANATLQERSKSAERYLELMGESEKNLGLLCRLCEYYVDGNPEKIIEFRHPIT